MRWIVPVVLVVLVFVAILVGRHLAKRARRRRLDWAGEPSQREFSAACTDYLYRDGWSYHGGSSRLFVEVARFRKNGKSIIFLFTTGRVQIDAMQRVLSVMRALPFGPIMVVTWAQADEHLVGAIKAVKWHCMPVRDLPRAESIYDTLPREQ